MHPQHSLSAKLIHSSCCCASTESKYLRYSNEEAPASLPTPTTTPSLVSVQIDMLGRTFSQLLVLFDQHPPNNPRARNRAKRKTRAGSESYAITRLIGLGPEIGAVDVSNLFKKSASRPKTNIYGNGGGMRKIEVLPVHQHSSWPTQPPSFPSSG